jgi:hypothetical protein
VGKEQTVGLGIPAADIVQLYKSRGRDIFPAPMSRLWGRLGRTFTQGVSVPKYGDTRRQNVLKSISVRSATCPVSNH